MTSSELQILLKAKDEASAVMKQAESHVSSSASGMSTAFGKVGQAAKAATLVLAGMGVGAIAMGVSFAKMAAEEQVGIERLRQAIQNAGGDWADLSGDVEDFVNASGGAFADDEMRDSLSILVAMTGDFDEAMRRSVIAMDLARGTGMDLATSSKLLGKVTDENVNVLKRYGIAATEGMDAQELLNLVQGKFSGQAATFAATAAGQWQIFNNTLDNLKEDIGAELLPAFTALATGAIQLLEDIRNGPLPEMMATAGKVKDVIIEMFGVLTGTAPFAGAALTEAMGAPKAKQLMAALASVRDAATEALEFIRVYLLPPLSEGVTFLKDNWESVGPVISSTFDMITTPARVFIQVVKDAIGLAQRLIGLAQQVGIGGGSSGGDPRSNPDTTFVGGRVGFAAGTPFVPQTGLALVHRGERITPASQNRGGAGGVTVNINGPIYGILDFEQQIKRIVRDNFPSAVGA